MEDYLTAEETAGILGRVRELLGQAECQTMRLLARGVRATSCQFQKAVEGIVNVVDGYQATDYESLGLPSASYWSREGVPIELEQPIQHALGGDFPSGFDEARRGILLFQWFRVDQIGEPVDEDSFFKPSGPLQLPDNLSSSPLAYEIFPPPSGSGSLLQVGSRGERLVFSRVQDCLVLPLEEVLGLVLSEEREARLRRLYAMYLENLINFPSHFSGDPQALLDVFRQNTSGRTSSEQGG